jgi:hypothetical protein
MAHMIFLTSYDRGRNILFPWEQVDDTHLAH